MGDRKHCLDSSEASFQLLKKLAISVFCCCDKTPAKINLEQKKYPFSLHFNTDIEINLQMIILCGFVP